MDAKCIVDGCDYSGPLESVEAHLSGSTEGGHKGLLGSNHRSELSGTIEEATEDLTDEEGDLLGLSTMQWMLVLVVGLALLWFLTKKGGKEPMEETDEEDEEESPGGLVDGGFDASELGG